jgi:uncharacterized protein with HEPN domain
MPLEARDRSRLSDMIQHSRDAMTLLGSRTQEEMVADLGVRHGVVRCIEDIGEAGHQISPETQAALPGIPWHLMWNMRNRLIHDYGNTNFRIVVKVVREELPGLVLAIEAYLATQAPPSA